jgi:putative PIN family toxin of toxin-antitoxin system
MRIVFDSNVIDSGLYSNRGASFLILRQIREAKIQPAISVALFAEYADVMGREPLASDFTPVERERFLDYFCSISYLTEIYFLWRPILKDPKDDMLLEVAVASNSSSIITHNTRDFEAASRFGVSVLKPQEFLTQMEASS